MRVTSRSAAATSAVRARTTSGSGSSRGEAAAGEIGIRPPIWISTRERKASRSSKLRPTGTIEIPRRSPPPLGAEGDPRHAGLERRQRRLAVAQTLGKERDHPAGGELLVAAGKGLDVARRVHSRVLPAVDRNRRRQPHQVSRRRMPPQGALGQKTAHPRQKAEHQHRIDQRVAVVGDDEQRPRGRHVLGADNLDLTKERLEDEAIERRQQAVESAAAPGAQDGVLAAGACQDSAAARPRSIEIQVIAIKPTTKKAPVERMAVRCEPESDEKAPKATLPRM